MRRKKIKIAFIFLAICCGTQNAFAQWYLDTATPEEAAVRDRPYQYLQNEIQKKLCDKDWGIDKSSFSFLVEKPDWKKIVRGGNTVRFTFTGGGDDCDIDLRETSPLYQANMDSNIAISKTRSTIMKWQFDQQKQVLQAKDPIATAQRFKKDHQKTIDSLNALDAKLNRQQNHLLNEKTFAQISLTLNDDRIQGKELQGFTAFKVQQLTIPGVQQAILYIQLPEEDDPDTSYRAALYIGDFPKFSAEMQPYSYKYLTKNTWTDKQHSGKPVVENCTIWIYTNHYNNMMKVLHGIDWTGLKQVIKKD